MVDLLEEMHLDEDIWVYGKISPIDIPVTRFVAGLYFPAEVLCDFGDHGVLGHWVNEEVLEMLMTTFLRVLNLSMRSILGLRISAFSI